MKKLLLLATAVSAVALASGAYADSVPVTTASLQLTGTVQPSVTFTGANNNITGVTGSVYDNTGNATGMTRLINLASFANPTNTAVNTTGFEATSTFGISANTPFNASISSTNKGLLNGSSKVPYFIGFDTDNTVSATNGAAKTYAANPTTIGVHYKVNASATDGTTAGLVSGQYSDTLTLSVSVQ